MKKQGLIWITGFSASGKTTVARKVEYGLKQKVYNVISLDGDDLRNIFSDRWGYDRKSREELAYTYFKLCSHLTSQGYTVVISAVAMFNFLEEWIRNNIPNSIQVLLRVPIKERILRDASTKKIFINKKSNDLEYEEKKYPDITIDNYGNVSADDSANKIIEFYTTLEQTKADKGRTKYRDDYYHKEKVPEDSSSYAKHVSEQLKIGKSILEIGCGNGRDSKYFASNGYKVTSIDRSVEAINLCKKYESNNLIFYSGEINNIIDFKNKKFDAVYCRFVLHAMPIDEETSMLMKSYDLLSDDGFIFIECRSINDQLFHKGDVVSPTERIYGHYRRFIIADEIKDKLESIGFTVTSLIEDSGMAVCGEDDPVVIRISASKSNITS